MSVFIYHTKATQFVSMKGLESSYTAAYLKAVSLPSIINILLQIWG